MPLAIVPLALARPRRVVPPTTGPGSSGSLRLRGVRRSLPRSLSAILLVAAGLLAVAGTASAAEAPRPADPSGRAATPETAEGATPGHSDAVSMRTATRTLERIWWNQPKMVESLELRQEQRAAMDRRLVAFLDLRREAGRAHLELRRELGDAVGAGRWTEAEEIRGRLAETAATLATAEADLVTKVVQGLDDAQRQRLTELYPRLLSVPWLRASGPFRLRNEAAPVAPGALRKRG